MIKVYWYFTSLFLAVVQRAAKERAELDTIDIMLFSTFSHILLGNI